MNKRQLVRLAMVAMLILTLLAAGFGPAGAQTPAGNEGPLDFVAGEILVKFQPGTPGQTVADVHRQNGGTVEKTIAGIEVQVVRVPVGQEQARATAYARNPNVAFAEVNGRYHAVGEPNDQRIGEQWQYNNGNDADIDAFEAWDVTLGSSSVRVAVLDTGISSSHPDLQGKVVASYNYTTSDTGEDRYGHGTHVAGSVAANTNNTIGVAGTCPNCSLTSVKVLGDDGGGSWDWIASGITLAADQGAKVINLSLGGTYNSSAVAAAVDYAWNKGVVVVAAAGNSSTRREFYPAAYNNVIAVAATDRNDAKASFSNFGSWVDVAAPGADILSTTVDGNYAAWSGTSMASPHVAGIAGLAWASGLYKTNAEVRAAIENGADAIPGTDRYWTYGRVNAYNVVKDAAQPTPNTPPTVSIVAPENGSAVSGTVIVSVDASDTEDAAGSLAVEIAIDEVDWQAASYNTASQTYDLSWDTTSATNGSHTIHARAADSDGSSASATSVGVTVENQTVEPTPSSLHIGDLDGAASGNRNNWSATVSATVHNNSENAVGGAIVSGNWRSSNGSYTSSSTCTTDTNGQCSVATSGSISRSAASVTFTVTSVSGPSPYYSGDNHDPDVDSNGTEITIAKP